MLPRGFERRACALDWVWIGNTCSQCSISLICIENWIGTMCSQLDLSWELVLATGYLIYCYWDVSWEHTPLSGFELGACALNWGWAESVCFEQSIYLIAIEKWIDSTCSQLKCSWEHLLSTNFPVESRCSQSKAESMCFHFGSGWAHELPIQIQLTALAFNSLLNTNPDREGSACSQSVLHTSHRDQIESVCSQLISQQTKYKIPSWEHVLSSQIRLGACAFNSNPMRSMVSTRNAILLLRFVGPFWLHRVEDICFQFRSSCEHVPSTRATGVLSINFAIKMNDNLVGSTCSQFHLSWEHALPIHIQLRARALNSFPRWKHLVSIRIQFGARAFNLTKLRARTLHSNQIQSTCSQHVFVQLWVRAFDSDPIESACSQFNFSWGRVLSTNCSITKFEIFKWKHVLQN